jgi:N-methylhydantoinase B
MTNPIDDLRLQVMWNRLISIVEEQAQTLMRTAFSTTVREAGDLSAGVFDRHGRMIAQAVTGTPGHVNSMAEGVRHFLDEFPPDTMAPGDHYITNDPWLTAGHLHDITVASPVFHHGLLVGLLANCCHQVDIGGLGQGPDARSIFEEGLQLPILKLASRGVLNRDLMAILRRNVRTPLQVEGDVMSYIAANETAARRLGAMLDEYGAADLQPIAEEIIERSYRATLVEIARLPRGTWHNTLTLDGMSRPITLRASLTIAEDHLLVDYAGTDPVVPHGINVAMKYCQAYSVFGLKCIIAPEVPNNAGALAPFRVTAPENCILNAQRPAPVAARHVVGQMLPDLVLGCLHQAIPGRVPAEGASCVWTVQLRGQTDAGSFESVFFNSGGAGARPGADGLSATAFPAGVRATPVEITETAAPVVVWRKELRPGSFGEGAARGGLGQIVEVGVRGDGPFEVLAMYERTGNPARGRDGGTDGRPGTVSLGSGGRLQSKGLQTIPAGDHLILALPGGGGFGNPGDRGAERLLADEEDGLLGTATD